MVISDLSLYSSERNLLLQMVHTYHQDSTLKIEREISSLIESSSISKESHKRNKTQKVYML